MKQAAGKTRILVTDDDNRLRELLVQFLEQNGYETGGASHTAEAELMLGSGAYHAMVLDVMMPGERGTEFAKRLRQQGNQIPILMLSAMGEVEDRIAGFEHGVDDYLPKPFEPRELLLRIESILKRGEGAKQKRAVRFGEFTFDIKTGDLRKDGVFVPLSSAELKLLTIFAEQMDQPISREELSRRLNHISERSIDVQVTRLRKKIEEDVKQPRHLQTAWGSGYVLRSRLDS